MKSKSRKTIYIVALALLLIVGLAASTQPDFVDRAAFRRPTGEILELEGDIRGAVESRAALGLNADPEFVQALRGSPEDVGTERFGIPMTEEETTEIEARFIFADKAQQTVLPYVESLPTFGGAFFDHQARGELVILLTATDDAVLEKIHSLAPEGRSARVEMVQYTQAQLSEAVPQAWEAWRAAGGPEAYAISVDTPANAIRIDVDPAEFAEAEKLVDEMRAAIGVPVFIGIGERPEEAVCTNRDNCYSPMKAGIVIRKGSLNSNTKCTMGFNIQVGSDEQFMTAGHCGYSGSNNWYHQGYGVVGTEQSTFYYEGGRDIMSVQISDSQDSSLIYNRSTPVNDSQWPITGEGVCASRGVSTTAWVCGTITDSYTSWTGGNCGCTIYGADSSIAFVVGDSGSPIVGSISQNVAIGVTNTNLGQFGIVRDALQEWDIWLRMP